MAKKVVLLFVFLTFMIGSLSGEKGPKIIYPSKVTVATLDPVFSWKYSTSPGISYEVKIAEDIDFTKNVITLRTSGPLLKLTLPYLKPSKTYYWTVRAVFRQNQQTVETLWAHEDKKDKSVFMFSVSPGATGNVGYSPLTLQPLNNSQLSTLQPVFKWTYPNHSEVAFQVKNIKNEWVSPKLENITYRLQISRSKDFTDNYKTFEIKNDTTRLRLSIPVLVKGNTYFWRVKAIYNDPEKLVEKESEWSGASGSSATPVFFILTAAAKGNFGFEEGQKEEVVDLYKLTSITQLTSGRGNFFAPSVSMDGTKLAYCSDKENQLMIYEKNLDEKYGSGETRKTVSPSGVSDLNPFWLTNSSELGFYSNRYNAENIWELFSTTRGTGTSVTFQTNRMEMEESPKKNNLFGSCSIDGKVIFTAKSRNNPIYRLLLKDLKDNSITDLRPGMFPCISNDDRIIFAVDAKGDGNFEIMVVELDGHSLNNPSILSAHESADYDPSISPDGERIVFVSTRSGNSDIWIMNSDGSGLRQLTFHPLVDRRPQWINNESIVFQSNRILDADNKPCWNIFKMEVLKN